MSGLYALPISHNVAESRHLFCAVDVESEAGERSKLSHRSRG
jgi:hypothetical protein